MSITIRLAPGSESRRPKPSGHGLETRPSASFLNHRAFAVGRAPRPNVDYRCWRLVIELHRERYPFPAPVAADARAASTLEAEFERGAYEGNKEASQPGNTFAEPEAQQGHAQGSGAEHSYGQGVESRPEVHTHGQQLPGIGRSPRLSQRGSGRSRREAANEASGLPRTK